MGMTCHQCYSTSTFYSSICTPTISWVLNKFLGDYLSLPPEIGALVLDMSQTVLGNLALVIVTTTYDNKE